MNDGEALWDGTVLQCICESGKAVSPVGERGDVPVMGVIVVASSPSVMVVGSQDVR